MFFSSKTLLPKEKQTLILETFESEGNEWNIILCMYKGLSYVHMVYKGSSYFDINAYYKFVINQERTVEGIYQFSQFDKIFGFELFNDGKQEVEIALEFEIIKDSYNSKEMTGFVGLKNLGATCYINSFMQTVFNINKFKNSIFGCEHSGKMRFLQNAFYKLQTEDKTVDITDFVINNVWNDDIHQHQDIHEFSKIFFDMVEKESKRKEIIEDLIQGNVINVIKAACNCKREIKENFQDLQVEIRDFNNNILASNLLESFRIYTKKEILNKDNQYKCDEHGYVDAEKYVLFGDLPPVLFILLKRFNMDYETGESVKINDKFEFPEILDFKEFSTKSEIYKLYSVIVHRGCHEEGHFYAYIQLNNKWYKFNDNIVTPVNKEEAIYNNYGGKHPLTKKKKDFSAYYLVYIKQDKIKELLESEVIIPSDLEITLNKKHKKYQVKCITFDDIRNYTGPGFYNINNYDYPLINYSECSLLETDSLKMFKNRLSDYKKDKSNIYIFEITNNGKLKLLENSNEDAKLNLHASYFVYRNVENIDFTKKKLVFVKIFKCSIWCSDILPDNLYMAFIYIYDSQMEDLHEDIKNKVSCANPVLYREENDGISILGNTSEINNGDILVIVERENIEEFLGFYKSYKARMCLNILYDESDMFTILVPRECPYIKLEEKVQDILCNKEVRICYSELKFKNTESNDNKINTESKDNKMDTKPNDNMINTEHVEVNDIVTVEDMNLLRNTIIINIGERNKLIYMGLGVDIIDFNTIKHIHTFVIQEGLIVKDMLERLLVKNLPCFSMIQKLDVESIRIVDTVRGNLYLKSYKINEVFTSEGMNCIQIFRSPRYLKMCYYSGMYKPVGYPFYVFTESETIMEFREEFKISSKLVKFDNTGYTVLKDNEKILDYGENCFVLLEVS